MIRKNNAWTAISPSCYRTLSKIAEENKIPVTKIVMNIIYNKMPENLTEDYTFSTANGRKMVIKLDDKEFKYITELAKKENVKISRFLRCVIYTSLKQENYIE
jgi:predicted DNA-binding ribbon-helix-helix protein